MTRWPERLASTALVVLAIVALGLAYGHARLSLAQTYTEERNHELALLHLDASRWLGPIESRWHFNLARGLLSEAEGGAVEGREPRARAIQHLQAALTLSPLWSDPWSWLAVTELQAKQPTEVLQLYLTRSVSLGPNETRNLVALLPWALLRWNSIAEAQQAMILASADHAARWVPAWLVSTAARYGQLYTFCDRIETRVWAVRHCQKAGWTLKERSDQQ